MQISRSSAFIAYELTEPEEMAGYTFNEANRAVIQNLISAAAEDFLLVGLKGEGSELILSLDEKLRVAELRGGINTLRYLLEAADRFKEQAEQKQNALNNPPQDPLM